MGTNSYKGVFSMDLSKKKQDFFSNLDRFRKKSQPFQSVTKVDMNFKAPAPSNPKKIEKKPKELKF